MGIKSVNISSVLMCVLMLGLVLGQFHVEALSCCRNTMARNCYNGCRLLGFKRETCAKRCDCKIVEGKSRADDCPDGYKSLTFVPDLEEEPDRIKYCSLGCRSSVCDYMNSVDGSKGMKRMVCGEQCDRFCNVDASPHQLMLLNTAVLVHAP